jgi:hypothetical protein
MNCGIKILNWMNGIASARLMQEFHHTNTRAILTHKNKNEKAFGY